VVRFFKAGDRSDVVLSLQDRGSRGRDGPSG
jgi:hypothetical protein